MLALCGLWMVEPQPLALMYRVHDEAGQNAMPFVSVKISPATYALLKRIRRDTGRTYIFTVNQAVQDWYRARVQPSNHKERLR